MVRYRLYCILFHRQVIIQKSLYPHLTLHNVESAVIMQSPVRAPLWPVHLSCIPCWSDSDSKPSIAPAWNSASLCLKKGWIRILPILNLNFNHRPIVIARGPLKGSLEPYGSLWRHLPSPSFLGSSLSPLISFSNFSQRLFAWSSLDLSVIICASQKRINKRKSSKSDTLKTFGFVVEAENELFGFDLVLFELGNLLVLLCDPRLELLCLSRWKLASEVLVLLKPALTPSNNETNYLNQCSASGHELFAGLWVWREFTSG